MGVYSQLASKYANSINESSTSNIINLMEMSIKCQNVQLSLFESMIELDILSAKNEAGMISLDESVLLEAEEQAKKSLLEKFLNLIAKFKKWISHVWDIFTTKLEQTFSTDKALIKKYSASIYEVMKNKDKYENVFNDKAPLIKYSNGAIHSMVRQGSIVDMMDNLLNDTFINIDDTEKVLDMSYFERFDNLIKIEDENELKSSIESLMKEFENNYLLYSDALMNEPAETINLYYGAIERINSRFEEIVMKNKSGRLKEIKNTSKLYLTKLKELENSAKKIRDNKNSSASLIIIQNAKIELFSKVSAYISKVTNGAMNNIKTYYAMYRKMYILIGIVCNSIVNSVPDTEEDKSVEESYNYMIGEASDLFVESALEF